MAEYVTAGDDRDREIAALRAEVAALRDVVESLRVMKMDPSAWQQAIYPPTAGATTTIKPWTNWCAAAAPAMITNYIVDAAGPGGMTYNAPFAVHGAVGGYAGQVYQVPVP